MTPKRVLFLWGPVVFWCLVIFAFSNRPTPVVTEFYLGDFIVKKTAHLAEYAILYFLLFRAINNLRFKIQACPPTARDLRFKMISIKNKIDWKWGLILLILYALSDEYHQSFILGRTARVRDVFIDLTGGLLCLLMIRKYLIKKSLGINPK